MICKTPLCDNAIEGKTEFCGTCNFMQRKAAKAALKPKKLYSIPKTSKKLKIENAKHYGKGGTKEQHLKEHPNCQIRIMDICDNVATQVHHCGKRAKNLNNKETFRSACSPCHQHVEFVMSAAERRAKGWLL